MVRGRFAPSPTGPLHFGSLVAALASWLDARAAGGEWLVRIEDVDLPRTAPGAAQEILRQLQALGLLWDGEVLFQSRRTTRYEEAIARLGQQAYPCGCTRKEIADSSLGRAADGAQIYPGTCRGGLPPGREARAQRLRVSGRVRFEDRLQGAIDQDLEQEVGDFVLRRADGLFAYQLAVVVDDADQGITDVVRGADLLASTPRQVYLQRRLGFPQPRYLHVPAATNAAGEKLSKQTGAAVAGTAELGRALAFLGQSPAATLRDAVSNWDPSRIPRARAISVE